VVPATQAYKTFLEDRLVEAEANSVPGQGLPAAYRMQIDRLNQLLASLDGDILDQLREIVNAVAVIELRAAGKFV
jgi:hypothetical protein